MYETTRLFLERVLPWPAAPSESGPYINIHRLKKFPKGDRPVMIGDACLTVDECIAVIHKQSRDPTNLDFYVCMSSQRECELRESRYAGGKTWRKAKRHQDDVHEIRSLFVDLDVRGDDAHKDAPYADTGEAATALQTFLDQANIPSPSLFVLTGSGGFHCHWVLSAPVGRSEWQVLAEALQNATVRHGLQVDPSVTTDSARVMRLPETRNSKAGNKLAELLPVQGQDYTVEEMRAYLAPYMGAKVVPIRDECSAGGRHPRPTQAYRRGDHGRGGVRVRQGSAGYWRGELHV
jgi:hypothetical protein